MEWLTTGQMIDKLKDGETAESKCGKKAIFKHGAIEFHDKTNNKYAYIHDGIIKALWRILPKYVSFEEAMKALKEGKIIEMYSNKTGMPFRFKKEADAIFHVFANMKMDFRDLIDGKWTIEE